MLASSVPAEKVSSTLTRFRVQGAGPGRGGADLSRPGRLVRWPTPVTIAHLSDLHFGGYADLAQIEALEEFLPTLGAAARSSPAT